MGGVADFIGDVVGDVVDAVGDAVEWVADTAVNVVENALDDPLKTALQVAAVATQQYWALPVIEGGDVLEEGGSVEDALKAAALTYATQQAVSFGMDSFGTPGVEMSGGETMQFFDDGTSIQFFDDGSTIFTDTAGAVSATPATDLITPAVGDATGFTPSGTEQPAKPGVSEITPIPEISPAEIAPIPGTPDVTPEVIAATTPPPQPQFENMEDLLSSIGELPPLPEPEPAFPEAVPRTGAPVDIARDIENVPPIPPDYQDRSMLDVGMELAKEAYDATPGWAIGLGLAGATGALGGPQEPPPGPEELPEKTYTYGEIPKIGATVGLEELGSAAQDIYGTGMPPALPPGQPQLPGIPTGGQPQLLGPSAPGGIASLRPSYTPISGGQTYDISQLTPEQIIQLQNMIAARRGI